VRREAAIARLRVAGAAAIPRLAALIGTDPDPAIKSAALRALEGADDDRVDAIALSVLDGGDDGVAIAALGVLRGRVTSEEGVRTLDALTALALDTSRTAAVRQAALDALSDLPRELVGPVLETARAAARAAATPEQPVGPQLDDPLAVREWIAADGATAPLSTVHDLIVRLRERERVEPETQRRQAWQVSRGAAHALLAHRGSRVALYDLRETFEAAADPLPLDFLTAVSAIGDASCLEPMAQAWSVAEGGSWWHNRLADAGRHVMRQAGLTGRNAVIRRIRTRWPGFL